MIKLLIGSQLNIKLKFIEDFIYIKYFKSNQCNSFHFIYFISFLLFYFNIKWKKQKERESLKDSSYFFWMGRNYGSIQGGKVEVKETCSQLELDLREEHTIIWTSDCYFNIWSMALITSYLKKVKLKLLKISSRLQNGPIFGSTTNRRFVENTIFA